ncbi:hypothetical protein IMZ48_43625 [Candidatus Bathyarchaeota archaeon]|nr:hypothetical protein [Candidatus Bathyarchaeota archaeon]
MEDLHEPAEITLEMAKAVKVFGGELDFKVMYENNILNTPSTQQAIAEVVRRLLELQQAPYPCKTW